jgi:hypothetical protein
MLPYVLYVVLYHSVRLINMCRILGRKPVWGGNFEDRHQNGHYWYVSYKGDRFSYGSTPPLPHNGPWFPHCWGSEITYTPHSVGLLWTGDQPDVEISAWQHTDINAPPAGFEPAIAVSELPRNHALDRAVTAMGKRCRWRMEITNGEPPYYLC